MVNLPLYFGTFCSRIDYWIELEAPRYMQSLCYHHVHLCCVNIEAPRYTTILLLPGAAVYCGGPSIYSPSATMCIDTIVLGRHTIPLSPCSLMLFCIAMYTYAVVWLDAPWYAALRALRLPPCTLTPLLQTPQCMQPSCYHHVHWCRCYRGPSV